MNEELKQDKVTLMSVEFDKINGIYNVSLAKGSNVAETAFAMTVVIKCLIRDNIIKEKEDVLSLVEKYLTDSQYEEITEVKDE